MSLGMETFLGAAAIVLGAIPVIHTEWNKYMLKRFEKGVGVAGSSDPKVQILKEKRAREGSEWKLWKSALYVAGIIIGAASLVVKNIS